MRRNFIILFLILFLYLPAFAENPALHPRKQDIAVVHSGEGVDKHSNPRILPPPPVSPEICGDGIDNDCDGMIDEYCNSCPIANAGLDAEVTAGELITLDGLDSADSDGDTLSYAWRVIVRPPSSFSEPSDPYIASPYFAIDMPGEYFLELRVSDGLCESLPDTVILNASPSSPTTLASSQSSIPHVGINLAEIYRGEEYAPVLTELGTNIAKVNLYWSNVEPTKGAYNWKLLDEAVAQSADGDLLIGFRTDSDWGTAPGDARGRPVIDQTAYYNTIFAMVCRAPAVKYWQNDCEPESDKYWSGTPEDYVVALRLFYSAVKAANPNAQVVLGGNNGAFSVGVPIGYAFFDYVFQHAGNSFDLFDVRLYNDPYTIVERVAWFRDRLRQYGLDKPIICTEYGGPKPQQFIENRSYIKDLDGQLDMGVFPEDLYNQLIADMVNLPPQMQMFLGGCDPELEALRYRIQVRDMNIRTILAMSAGVERLYLWALISRPAFDGTDYLNPIFGHLRLSDETLTARYPGFDGFRRMLSRLYGVNSVSRIDLAQPNIYFFELTKEDGSRFYAIWEKRDLFHGEELPPTQLSLRLTMTRLRAMDVFGNETLQFPKKRVFTIPVTDTPLYLSEAK